MSKVPSLVSRDTSGFALRFVFRRKMKSSNDEVKLWAIPLDLNGSCLSRSLA